VKRSHAHDSAPPQAYSEAQPRNGHVSQRDDSAQKVQRVQARQQIKERTVRMRVNVNALTRQLPPRCDLPGQKGYAEQCGQSYPNSESLVVVALERATSKLDAKAAD